MNESRYDLHLFEEFFDWQPQAFVWLSPVFGEDDISVIDFEYTYSNDVGLTYLKLSREMLGRIRITTTPSLTNEMRQGVFAEMLHVYTTGETVEIEMYNPVINKYAKVYRIKFRGGVLTTIQDKTEERIAIQQLKERTRELQHSNDNLKEFAYAASHDLQEPLRKIASFSEMLQQELHVELNPRQQGLFDRLRSSVARMKTLIEDLLEYSRVSVQREAFSKVSLQDVVGGVLQDLERLIHEHRAVFKLDPLPVVNGDARQLRQLFYNLFSNAIKYRKPEAIPQILVHCTKQNHQEACLEGFSSIKEGEYWLIRVEDNGIGFDQQYEEKIFQLFQRLHGRFEYEGTGIGLSIVQKVVANHNGYIKAFGRPQQGASFLVLLPTFGDSIGPK